MISARHVLDVFEDSSRGFCALVSKQHTVVLGVCN